MTYCVGMRLNKGLIFMSDTRTNAGVDNISVFKKCFTWEIPGERVITVLTAGNLATTQAGLALHPVSQALQEYPQMAEHYAAAHEMLAKDGETVQLLGRVGYGPQIPRTPRWPLETKLI